MLPAWLPDTVTADLGRALHYTLLWGLEGVEVRTVGGPEDRVPHVNAAKIGAALAEREILPVSVCPSMFEGQASQRATWLNELAMFGDTLRLAVQLGSPRVVVGSFAAEAEPVDPDVVAGALRRAGDRAAKHGRTVCVLNHAEMTCATGAELAAMLGAVNHDHVRAAWHPAQALRAGEDPADGLAALGERVSLVRVADGRVAEDGALWEEMVFGEGEVGWGDHLEQLRAQGFRGPLSLEVNLDPAPTVGLHAATDLIQALRYVRS